jgi:hypothetical protein
MVHMAWNRHVTRQHKHGGVISGHDRIETQSNNLVNNKTERQVVVLERVVHA